MKLLIVQGGLYVAVVALVCASFAVGLFSGVESFLEDRLFTVKPVSGDIIIGAIDDESIRRIGQWPWPRAIFADALMQLNKTQPAAVGLDVIFSEPSRLGLADDEYLVQALEKISYKVVFPVELHGDATVVPLLLFQKARVGHVNIIQDNDGVVRTFPWDEFAVKPFAYEALKAAGKKIPVKENFLATNRIVYAGKPGTIRQIPFWRLLENPIPAGLKDKVIFIGVTAADLHDNKPIPFSGGRAMAGIEIHGNIANMLLKGYRLINFYPPAMYFWFIAAAFVPLVSFVFLTQLRWAIMLNGGLGILYLAVQAMLFSRGIVANIIHVHLAWFISSLVFFAYRYFIMEKEKRHIQLIFAKYVSKEVLSEIVNNPQKLKLGGERKKLSVLFSDIRGFTSISEGMTPENLMHIINEYLSVMSDIIMARKGLVDKYIGDAIMAFWGAPLRNDHQAFDACTAAISMIEGLQTLNKRWQSLSMKTITIGIGINTGEAVVGNMGSKNRWNYSALGDEVNVASRLEGLNKMYGTECIISESVNNEIAQYGFPVRELDRVIVKGKKESTRIYELMSPAAYEEKKKALILFAEGKMLYTKGLWDEAMVKFKSALQCANDGPSQTFLDRCIELKQNVPFHWRGIYELRSK